MFDPVLTGKVVTGAHDMVLVMVSYVLAVVASFTALNLAVCIGKSRGATRKIWIGGCALSMGGGIWSMHFTAMLAFQMPLAVSYNIGITLLSLVIAVVASGFAFFLANTKPVLTTKVISGGIVMGVGVATMHYTGMAAMQFEGSIHYRLDLFVLSVLIAVLASTAALGLIIKMGEGQLAKHRVFKICGALVMGLAVAGMHFSGMAATIFVASGDILSEIQNTPDVRLLALGIAAIAFVILGAVAFSTEVEFKKLMGTREALELQVQERTSELQGINKRLHAEIKERKRAEKRFEALSKLSHENPNPLMRVNQEGIISYANPRALWLLGHWNRKISDSIPAPFQPAVKEVLFSRHHVESKIDINGRTFLFEVVYVPGENYINLYGKDVTDLEKARRALIDERQNLYQMLDNLPVAFHMQAPDYSIPFANKMFRERFGDPEQKKCYEVMHKRSEPCEVCSTFRVFDTGKNESGVWQALDGRHYLTVCTPYSDIDGSPLIMEMAVDVTQQKQAEDALRKAHDTLEERVRERTAELEESNAELEKFAFIASHDLQEPLRKIISFADLLKGRGFDKNDPEYGYLERMQNAADRMRSLVDDILKLSQVTTQAKSFQPTDLNEVVREVLADLENQIFRTSGSVNVESLPTVAADPLQMHQLFQNLLSNGLKYHCEGRPPEIRVRVSGNGNGIWEITVQDNGIGFEQKYAERIFRPFERLHGRSAYEGTGIGLAICEKIVKRHNGTIAVKSAPDKGSTFTITFPQEHPEKMVPTSSGI